MIPNKGNWVELYESDLYSGPNTKIYENKDTGVIYRHHKFNVFAEI